MYAMNSNPVHSVDEKMKDVPSAEEYLIQDRLESAETALSDELRKHPHNDQIRFALGTAQFLRAVEQLAQSLYRHGMRGRFAEGLGIIPGIDSPLPINSQTAGIKYEDARAIADTFAKSLDKAETTLAQISDPDVKMPLHFGLIHLDLDGDGQVTEDDSLWKLYSRLNRTVQVDAQTAKDFYICFDRGDVHWLRGYCHLLKAFCEMYLAYDSRETFNCTAHLFFTKVDSPYKFLAEPRKTSASRFDTSQIMDVIALIHLIRWQVVEPQRMTTALHDLEAVVAQSKESWKWIMAETDDDHEWIPNPNQTGVIPNVKVTNEMVAAWLDLMDQSGKILEGKLLLPFWRGNENLGVNVRKVFTEPQTFDLILWVQGSSAGPYLEKGELADQNLAARLQRTFGTNFPGFALWFN
jgi:hypothetical protein